MKFSTKDVECRFENIKNLPKYMVYLEYSEYFKNL